MVTAAAAGSQSDDCGAAVRGGKARRPGDITHSPGRVDSGHDRSGRRRRRGRRARRPAAHAPLS